MKKRLLTAGLCLALLICCLSTTVFAYADDPGTDTGGVDLWEGLDPVEALPVETPEPNPFTPSGTGTVTDNATDEDGKEFFTITTADESTFYLVIDRQRGTENVYFLNAVTVADLAALAEANGQAVPGITEPMETEKPDAADPEPDAEPEPPAETKNNTGMLLLIAAVALIGGGAGWYFKIYRPKQQRAAENEEDYGEAEYDDNPPWDEDEDIGEDEE